MRIIKRLGTTFSGYIEQLVTTIEDPEEVLKAAIREIDRNLVKAELRLKKVKADGQQMSHSLSRIEKEIELWDERARKESTSNRERALECLRRKKHSEKRRDLLLVELEEHTEAEDRLREDIEAVQQKRRELKSKLHLLSTRDARSKAIQSCNTIFDSCNPDLDEVIDRWELHIAMQEGVSSARFSRAKDTLKEEYESKEEQEALEQELDQMLSGS